MLMVKCFIFHLGIIPCVMVHGWYLVGCFVSSSISVYIWELSNFLGVCLLSLLIDWLSFATG